MNQPSLWLTWVEVASGGATVTVALYSLMYFVFWPRFKEAVCAIVDERLEDVVTRLQHVDGLREHVGRFGEAVNRFEENVNLLRSELERQGRAIERMQDRMMWPNRMPSDSGR